MSMNALGNDLYTGKRSFPFVPRRGLWLVTALILVAVSIVILFVKPPTLSIEFTGGAQFTVSGVSNASQAEASETVGQIVPDATPKVAIVGTDTISVKTDRMSQEETDAVRAELAAAYNVDLEEVTASFVGPSWGEGVTRQSLWGLGIFLALAFLILAIYFRTWKMSVAAIIGLIDVLVITVGVYSLAGFEVSPAAVIGFLTILGYSLYDTTVVFDKIRETTSEDGEITGRTFGESVNLGINQTVVRSINTSVVAVIPVAAILIIGALWLGADTLSDISLAITVGIIVAAYSTLFVAAPMYSLLRDTEPAIKARDQRVLEVREREAAKA